VDLPDEAQLMVAHTAETAFPTVLALSVEPLPESWPPFDYGRFTDQNVSHWIRSALESIDEGARVLDESRVNLQGRFFGLKGAGLVRQVMSGRSQPSIVEILFVGYEKNNVIATCSTFNSIFNENILMHFYRGGGFPICSRFFDSLTFKD
jgi:hypothetical protein